MYIYIVIYTYIHIVTMYYIIYTFILFMIWPSEIWGQYWLLSFAPQPK